MKKRLLLLALAAMAAPLALAAPAHAGTYHITAPTSQNVDAWRLTKPTGYWGCSYVSRPGPCSDSDVAMPTPLRIFAQGSVNAEDEAFWYWVTPPTVTIASGSVDVTYATSADTRVYMKARMRSYAFASQPQLHTASNDGSATWAIPSGMEAVGVFLKSTADHTFSNKWSNTIRIDSIDATLRDDTAPAATVSGDLAGGRWLNDVQTVCTTVGASDAGSGVLSSELRDETGALLDRHALPMTQVMQPGAASYVHELCVVPASLDDGRHDLTVRVADAAGETVDVPLGVAVDTHAPSLMSTTPAETTDRRPLVSFAVDGGPSGLAGFQAAVDGQPMTVAGGTATFQPAADLAFGRHTVTWSATDGAGNRRDGSWSFQVADAVAPQLTGPAPADGASAELRRPAIGFTLVEDGSGIDAATLRVLLDGADVAPFGTLVDGAFAYTPPADLAYGHHTISVAVSDRYGNAMAPQRWGFDVVDLTAPVLGDVRPDDGSAGSDRTPPISVAVADAGTGIDPARLLLTLDGADVSAAAVLSGGRLSYQTAQPLGYGAHVVTAQATDRSGNRSPVLSWTFTVRDETPPVISDRAPRPGATVTGPVAVTFTAADAGTGVDDGSLQVLVDGQDVTGWSTFTGGRFVYDPGTFAAGVHTVSVTVADVSGNVTGPVMWQFAAVDPARIDVAAVSVPAHITAGQAATLRFAATSNGAPLAGVVLRLTSREAGQSSFGAERTSTTAATGEVAWDVRPTVTTDYRVELVDSGSLSVMRTVVVAQRVSLSAARSRVARGTAIRLTGAVAPGSPGATVRVQMLTHRGWVTVARPRLSARSRYGATLVPRVRGRYVFRVSAPATDRNAAALSRQIAVRVV